jgi:hypothetical protein
MKPSVCIAFALLALTGCATARVVGPPIHVAEDPAEERAVVLEPFFEQAEWQTVMQSELYTMTSQSVPVQTPFGVGYGTTPAQTVVVQRPVQQKPIFAQVKNLALEYAMVMEAVRKLRPKWKVVAPTQAMELPGPITVVRTVVRDSELIESDRSLKNLAFGFGLLILPLQLVHLSPVQETVRVYGSVQRYGIAHGAEVQRRLIKYASQPDAAVNTEGLSPLNRELGLDLAYEEGLLADEGPRELVLIEAFSMRLAAAVVALVEEP